MDDFSVERVERRKQAMTLDCPAESLSSPYARCLKIAEISSYFPVSFRLFWKRGKKRIQVHVQKTGCVVPKPFFYATSGVYSMVSTAFSFAFSWTVSNKSILSKCNDPGLYRKKRGRERGHLCFFSSKGSADEQKTRTAVSEMLFT